MVSRENKVVAGLGLGSLVLSGGGFLLTDLSSEALIGILIIGGIVAPVIVNDFLDSRK